MTPRVNQWIDAAANRLDMLVESTHDTGVPDDRLIEATKSYLAMLTYRSPLVCDARYYQAIYDCAPMATLTIAETRTKFSNLPTDELERGIAAGLLTTAVLARMKTLQITLREEVCVGNE